MREYKRRVRVSYYPRVRGVTSSVRDTVKTVNKTGVGEGDRSDVCVLRH